MKIVADPGSWFMVVGLFLTYGVYYAADQHNLVGVVVFGLFNIICFFGAGFEIGKHQKKG